MIHYKPFSYLITGKSLRWIQLNDSRFLWGDGIDERDSYGEMRAHYWVWKDVPNYDWFGFHHYRRAFLYQPLITPDSEWHQLSEAYHAAPWVSALTMKPDQFLRYTEWMQEQDFDSLFSQWDIIVPRIERMQIRQQYIGSHRPQDWEVFAAVLRQFGYDDGRLPHVMFYNMFVMGANLFDRYMTDWWGVMQKVEPLISLPPKEDYQRRALGFLSERFLPIWLHRQRCENPGLKVLSLPVVFAPEIT